MCVCVCVCWCVLVCARGGGVHMVHVHDMVQTLKLCTQHFMLYII